MSYHDRRRDLKMIGDPVFRRAYRRELLRIRWRDRVMRLLGR